MQPLSMQDTMREHELALYLTKLIEEMLHEIKKELKISLTPAQTKQLAENIAHLLKNKEIDFSYTKDIKKNPQFIQMLKIATYTMAKLGKHEDLLKELLKIFKNENKNDPKNEKKLTAKELMKLVPGLKKKLTPEEIKKLDLLLKKIEEMPGDMHKLKLARSPNKELLGCLEFTTGAIQIVVTKFTGNLFGITDRNPYNGTAPIDQQNKTTSELGDPFGLHEMAEKNFDAAGKAIDAAENKYLHAVKTPTLSR
jgi:hypothetical protein